MTCNIQSINTSSSPFISYKGDRTHGKTNKAEEIENDIVATTDNFIDKIDRERKKKKNRIAFAAAGGGVLLSAFVFLLNPKFSGKLIQAIKTQQFDLKHNAEQNGGKGLKSKFYQFAEKRLGFISRSLEFTCNVNSIKDIAYTRICTRKAETEATDSIWQKLGKNIRNLHVSVMKKPHEWITKCGDNLAKATVKGSYKSSLKKMNKLENTVNMYKTKLTPNEQQAIETELAKLTEFKNYCSKEQVMTRLDKQTRCMENLETDTMKDFKKFWHDLFKKSPTKKADLDNDFKFWAQEHMQPEKEKLEQAGNEELKKIIGEKGAYTKIADILKKSDKLNQTEKNSLEGSLQGVIKSLQEANKNETEKYFYKKKDLVLGSAPTDILTAVIGSVGCGIYLANADTKEERISKTITNAVPVITTLATNVLLTALLWSGGKSLAVAGIIGFVVGRIGSYIDHKLFGHDNDVIEETNKKTETEAGNV